MASFSVAAPGTRTTIATPARSVTVVFTEPATVPALGGASTTIPATYSPGASPGGTVIVTGTATVAPAAMFNSACGVETQAPTPVLRSPNAAKAVPPPLAVMASAGYTFSVIAAAVLFVTLALSVLRAPGSSV